MTGLRVTPNMLRLGLVSENSNFCKTEMCLLFSCCLNKKVEFFSFLSLSAVVIT